ncbi:beta-hexosaminidase [Pararobbsia silviterrae]|uniref:Beta-hexosaminidase n=1 Tax=Pararobbsia silviterrae TaxID=1792498 RepID=A0A494X7G4_9BURK|nr:beta-hexosaminidase [Pararobbsia silviterrae]
MPYDPNAPRPTTPILVGPHVVARRPYSTTQYTLYTIMDGDTPVRSQLSMPGVDDCASAIRKHRAEVASRETRSVIGKAKTRGWQPIRVKAVA